MLHGKTTIELTDVRTGSRERIVEHNMFTGALNDAINRAPFYFNNPSLAKFDNQYLANLGSFAPASKFALGGLILLGMHLDEDENTFFAPVENKPVGIASNDGYSGGDARRGSYNSILSKPIDNGFRQVWDFATTQANGTIACACLTSSVGGKGFLDLDSWMFHSNSNGASRPTGIIYSREEANCVPFGANETGIFYMNWNNRHVYKKNVPVHSLSLTADTAAELQDLGSLTTGDYSLCFYEGHICKIEGTRNSSGNCNVTITHYDPATLAVIATVPVVASAQIGTITRTNSATIRGGYVYVPGYESTYVVKINIATPADVSRIDVPVAGTLMSACGDLVFSTTWLIESDNTVRSKTNSSIPFYRNGVWFLNKCSYDYGYVGANVQANYLATINNLSTAVTKTSNQTMQVTYEITNA